MSSEAGRFVVVGVSVLFLGVVVCIVFVLDVCGYVVGLVGVWMLRV